MPRALIFRRHPATLYNGFHDPNIFRPRKTFFFLLLLHYYYTFDAASSSSFSKTVLQMNISAAVYITAQDADSNIL